jgi:vitamin B12 transport system substrate-binding protein
MRLRCGARNVFADLSWPAPQVSIEAVLQRNPQVILAGDQAQLDAWKAWPRWKRWRGAVAVGGG